MRRHLPLLAPSMALAFGQLRCSRAFPTRAVRADRKRCVLDLHAGSCKANAIFGTLPVQEFRPTQRRIVP
jgi:hypothetical protein